MLLTGTVRAQRLCQDYKAWQSFGTAKLWQEILESPELAAELLCQHISRLGLINPSERTSASLAAASLVAMHGPQAASVIRQTELDNMFKFVKASLQDCTFSGDNRILL